MDKLTVKEVLKKPYTYILTKEEKGYSAFVLEFDGCYADGESIEEASKNLEKAAEAWVEGILDDNTPIPEPCSNLLRNIHHESHKYIRDSRRMKK